MENFNKEIFRSTVKKPFKKKGIFAKQKATYSIEQNSNI
jgi:hypothetical protein